MKKRPPSSANDDWLARYFPKSQAAGTGLSQFRPVLSPTEEKAEETARVARELIEAEAAARRATAARLRAARLESQAEVPASAAGELPSQEEDPDAKG